MSPMVVFVILEVKVWMHFSTTITFSNIVLQVVLNLKDVKWTLTYQVALHFNLNTHAQFGADLLYFKSKIRCCKNENRLEKEKPSNESGG